MRNFKKCCLAIIAIALFGSCQKEEGVRSEEEKEVQFFANYSNTPYTKATTSFTTGNKATIYACRATESPSSTTFTQGTPLEATAQAGGTLEPTTPLFLPKGSYNFYSVSDNSASSVGLDFSSGVSEQLTNDIDYLWAKATNVNEGGIVTFTYTHKAVAIKIQITGGTGVSNINVSNIKITPSKPSITTKMNLATGIIEATDNIDVLTPMALANNIGEIIMVPLTSNSLGIEVTANLTIGSTTVNGKVYEATIPSRVYEGGYYYTLNLTIDSRSITFSGAQLEDWTTQTITGVTLIES